MHAYADTPLQLDRYVLSELYSLEVNCRYAYDTYDVAQVLRRASEFVTSTLSSLYSELSKDVLYASAKNDPQRQVTIAVMSKVRIISRCCICWSLDLCRFCKFSSQY